MKNKSTLLSKILQCVIDGAQLCILLFGFFTLLKLTNIFIDQNIIEKSLLAGIIFAFFTFIKLQYFDKK